MKAFLWPQRRAETGIFVRFGRAIHWLFAGVGVIVLVIGVAATTISAIRVASYHPTAADQRIAIHDTLRAADEAGDTESVRKLGAYFAKYPTASDDPYAKIGTPVEQGVNGGFSYPENPAPYIHWEGLWIGLCFGLPLFFIGRGIRYILADE